VTRRFVIIGREANASDEFLLDDVPGTSGRLDIGLRCVRAAMLLSHGLRRDVVVDLVLGGGPRAPRVLRVRGAEVKFLRPDERSLAVLAKKVLAGHADDERSGYVEVKPGIAVARGGLPVVLADLAGATPYVLEEQGVDVRDVSDLAVGDSVFFLGDPGGFDPVSRASLEALGARAVRVGPLSLHAEDVVVLVNNELDRRLSPWPAKLYPRAP
jgi:tRNA (pseudouridine54-N1)-methyltransferase